MNTKIAAISVLAWLVMTAAAPAQEVDRSKPAEKLIEDSIRMRAEAPTQLASRQKKQMYEDIEIMRRLLSRRAQSTVYSEKTHVWSIWDGRDFKANETGDRKETRVLHQPLYNSWIQFSDRPMFAGYYIPSHGLVFTAEMPYVSSNLLPTKAPMAKPESEWERLRAEIRGDSPEVQENKQEISNPTLSDEILKVLAENGKNLSTLNSDLIVTVAITLHASSDKVGALFNSYSREGLSTGGNTQYLWVKDAGKSVKPSKKWIEAIQPLKYTVHSLLPAEPKSMDHGREKKSVNSPTDESERLGDLHMKQGKHAEALKAYLSAKRLKGWTYESGEFTDDELVEFCRIVKKIASVRVLLGEYDDAIETLRSLRKFQESTPLEPPRTQSHREKVGERRKSPLPPKLIITAPKKLLDQVGHGKITFEEFKRKVKVEYIRF